MEGTNMQKSLIISFLVLAFGLFLIACQNGVNPAETAGQPGDESLEKAVPKGESEPCGGCEEDCELTPGYWKNHPEAWPLDNITVGGETYTKEEAIEWMSKPVAGDKSITMFKALVAAMLNVEKGCDVSCCITSVIAQANEWMADHPVGSGVKARSDAWQGCKCNLDGEELYLELDQWNNFGC
jgi:hypothetical protein